MNQSTVLALAGVLLLVASVAVPLGLLATSQTDTDYVYTVERGGLCSTSAVQDPSDVEENDDYHIDYENLSATGREHFERALADGQYVVEDEAEAAPDFRFADDHFAAGEGCYAVSYEGEDHALRTNRVSQFEGPASGPWPFRIGVLLLVLGAGSVLAGVGLAVKRRRG